MESNVLFVFARLFDLTVVRLEFLDVVFEGLVEHLRVSRGHDDARVNAGLLRAGGDAGEIDHEFLWGVDDQGQIRVDALGFGLFHFDFELLLPSLLFHGQFLLALRTIHGIACAV